MARDSYAKVEREKHILGTIKNMKYHLSEAYPQYVDGCMEMYIDKSSKEDMETEIFMNFNLKHFPLRDYRGIMSEMNTVINEYSNINIKEEDMLEKLQEIKDRWNKELKWKYKGDLGQLIFLRNRRSLHIEKMNINY